MSIIASVLSGHKPTLTGKVTFYNCDLYRKKPEKAPAIQIPTSPKAWDHLRAINEKNMELIVKAINDGFITQAAITFATSLARSTVCVNLKQLVEDKKVAVKLDLRPHRYEAMK